MNTKKATCDATIEDRGRLRHCQHPDGHYPDTRHYSEHDNGASVMEWTDEAEFAKPASSSPLRPQVRVTRYTVNCMPQDAAVPDARLWAVQVEEWWDGTWSVSDGHSYLDAGGDWHETQWEAGRHGLDTALRLAKEAAPDVRVRGMTPAAALARIVRLREES